MSIGIAVRRGNFSLYKTHKSIFLSASVPCWGPGQPPNPSPVGGPAVSGSHATQVLFTTLLLNTLFSLSHDSSLWLIFDTHRNWVSQMWTQKQTVNLLLKGTVSLQHKGLFTSSLFTSLLSSSFVSSISLSWSGSEQKAASPDDTAFSSTTVLSARQNGLSGGQNRLSGGPTPLSNWSQIPVVSFLGYKVQKHKIFEYGFIPSKRLIKIFYYFYT